MNINKGYYKEDLKILHFRQEGVENSKKIKTETSYKMGFYIYWVIQGEIDVWYNNYRATIKKDHLLILQPNSMVTTKKDRSISLEILSIWIHPSIISEQYDDNDFARVFYKFCGEDAVININSKEFILCRKLLKSICDILDRDFGRSHLMPRINSVISELDLYCDKLKPREKIPTDSIPVEIINYIQKHYLEDITYDSLTNRFFISRPTLCTIVRNFTGITLKEYVTSLRLRDAQNYINAGLSVTKAAELSGYKCYSTFFRVYKQYYGVMPKENLNRKEKKWPLL